ncbi:hypothetical protein HDE69_004043 [Pedobacter cryoconitis]|uniref:Uncharacterized protein n=1 Tax=Pedobacter cryoconitis TaxID=188932 RepID=A0A7W8YWB4_9SPHI|nr:hypothetical protein [Pedobacter cryoconitis]MBB5644988.1 hypothetical protein [Pedobacter cryoconitis]
MKQINEMKSDLLLDLWFLMVALNCLLNLAGIL